MKRFHCHCGQEIYFNNRQCLACGSLLAFDHNNSEFLSLQERDGGLCRALQNEGSYRLCQNRLNYGICNGAIAEKESSVFCLPCSLNKTIPDLSATENIHRWRRIEAAKSRLIYGLFALPLPVCLPNYEVTPCLHFEFLEDQRTNPNVPDEFISTGHQNGLVTLNILEADDILRAQQMQLSAERYRTVLGHFRHESGHFYYPALASDQERFASLFGNPELAYNEALQNHYQNGAPADWANRFISAYASSHPLEDWAETFAHYLHIVDSLETACSHGLIDPGIYELPYPEQLSTWSELVVALNEMNRSLGLRDAYPFYANELVSEKLGFVHQAIEVYKQQSAY